MAKLGLHKNQQKAIESAVDTVFDRIRARYLSPSVVSQYGDKKIEVSWHPEKTLQNLYATAAQEGRAKPHLDVMESLARMANTYLEASAATTKARVVATVDGILRNAEEEGIDTDFETVLTGELNDVFGKAKRHVTQILEEESNKAKAIGTVEGIARVNAALGIEDPVMYFIVVRDGERCDECTRLHLLEDKVTPRVYKMSEIKSGFHKRHEDRPCLGGLHPNCFTGDNYLHTSQGMVKIEDLFKSELSSVGVCVDARIKNRRIGNNQMGAKIPGKTWFDRHASGCRIEAGTPVYDTGVQECLLIKLENGQEIKVSNGHEMFVDDDKNGVKIAAKNLSVGCKIPVLSGEAGWGTDSFPELAELMGNLMGDGQIDSVTAGWNFFGNDLPYGQELREMANGITGTFYGALEITAPDDKYQVSRAHFNSTVLRDIFVKDFGLCKKPRRVPKRLFQADKKTVAAFLCGLFSADGHSQKESVVLAQNDYEFLQEIQLLLINFGIKSQIYTHGEEVVHKTITYADGRQFDTIRKPCWRLYIGGWAQRNRFKEEIGFGVSFKTDHLEKVLDEFEDYKRRGSWRTSRIESITPLGPQQTYCLTEPMSNSLVVNGIVTGNCRCVIASLPPGYGFEGGSVSFISFKHDEFKNQRG